MKETIREDYEALLTSFNYSVDDIQKLITDMAEKLGITTLLDDHPYDISGGERQKQP